MTDESRSTSSTTLVETCMICDGQGVVEVSDEQDVTCPNCGGSGEVRIRAEATEIPDDTRRRR